MARSDRRVRFHGLLSSDGIRKLAGRAHVGLSSFALFRKRMQEACTLKVREYLMMGVPVYAGHRDVFPQSFDYYRCGACDMSAILTYAGSMANVQRERVVEASKQYIDKDVLLQALYEWVG